MQGFGGGVDLDVGHLSVALIFVVELKLGTYLAAEVLGRIGDQAENRVEEREE